MKRFFITIILASPLFGFTQTNTPGVMKKETPLTCKLTSKELQERKATVLASLKKQVLRKKSLSNGYGYEFKGTDELIDELSDFIKTERQCCDFFDFTLNTKGDGSATWLYITGPKGVKYFISSEMGL